VDGTRLAGAATVGAATSFARERYEAFVRAALASHVREASAERSAGQELAELALDEAGKAAAVGAVGDLAQQDHMVIRSKWCLREIDVRIIRPGLGRRGGPRETLVVGVRAHPGRGHAETAPQAGLSARSEEISPVGRALLHGQFARRILGRPKHLPVLRSKSNKDVLRGEPSEYSNPGLGSVQRISQTSSGGGFSRIM